MLKKIVFLNSLMTAALVIFSIASANAQSDNQHERGTRSYHRQQHPRDYYPIQPRYHEPPPRQELADGVLGSPLGYEIVKDGSTAGSNQATDVSLSNSALKK